MRSAVLRSDIERALDDLVSQEEGMRFQSLAVILVKLRWPELIASERRWDQTSPWPRLLGSQVEKPAAPQADSAEERLTRSRGRAIITASRAAEVSLELPELGHGVFTHYLVQGLRGTADLDRDGIVSLQELYEYLEQQVSIKSRAAGGNQHPVMKGELEGVLPLVRVRRQ